MFRLLDLCSYFTLFVGGWGFISAFLSLRQSRWVAYAPCSRCSVHVVRFCAPRDSLVVARGEDTSMLAVLLESDCDGQRRKPLLEELGVGKRCQGWRGKFIDQQLAAGESLNNRRPYYRYSYIETYNGDTSESATSAKSFHSLAPYSCSSLTMPSYPFSLLAAHSSGV
jgi:hypothetical protein